LRLRCKTSENEIPLGHNASTRIFTTRGYVWPMNTLDPDYLAPEQFSKMAEGSDDFACACVCVEFRVTGVIAIAFVCARVASESRALHTIHRIS